MRYINSLDEALEILTSEDLQRSCVITDPTQPDNPIVYVTSEFERQTGYPREEVLGRNCRFLQGTDTDPATVARIRDAIDRMLPLDVEILNYRKNGSPFWNRLSLRPMFSEVGKLQSFVASQRIREVGENRYDTDSDTATRRIGETVLLRYPGLRRHGLDRLTRPMRRNRSSHP